MGILREKKGRQDIIELGKDTDSHLCKKLGGKKIEGTCAIVTSYNEDGDIVVRRVASAEESP